MKLYQLLYFASVTILALYVVYLLSIYSNIPQIIPIHYSGKTADGFGDKSFVWLEVGLNAVLLIIIGGIIFSAEKLFINKHSYLELSPDRPIKNRQFLMSVIALMCTFILCGISFLTIP